jgi:two-component sensor histidine kinase
VENKQNTVRLNFSSKSFGLFAIASVTSLPLLNLRGDGQDFQLLLGLGLAVTALTGFLIFLIDLVTQTFRQNLSDSQNNKVMVLLIAVIGLIRGYFSYIGLGLLDFPEYAELPIRLATSTSSTLLWLTLAIYLVSMHEKFKNDFDSFIRTSFNTLSKVEPAQLRKIPSALAPEIKAIEVQIQKSLSHMYESVVTPEILLSVSQQLRDCIETSIRPLSHRLWLQDGKVYPRISLRALLREGLDRQDFSIYFAVSFLALLSSFNLSSSIGVPRASLAIFITFAITSGYFLVQRKYVPNISMKSKTLKVLNLSAPGLALSGVFYLLNTYIFSDDLGFLNLFLLPISFTVFLLASTIRVVREDQSRFFSQLKLDIDSRITEQVNNQDQQSGKEVAAFLHNSVQSELLALSYQLEELSKNPDSKEAKVTLERLASSLTAQIGKNFENFNEKPTERLSTLVSAWSGIALVEYASDPDVLSGFSRAHDVVQVIEESITNAVRTANATIIRISWERTASLNLCVEVKDNGHVDHIGASGLGTQWLDEIAFGRWSRETIDGQTTLVVNFSE